MELKAKKFLGKKVLDSDLFEVGEVSDFEFDTETWLIKSLMVSTGVMGIEGSFKVTCEEVDKVGDQIMLKLKKEEIDERAERPLQKSTESAKKTLENVGKSVTKTGGDIKKTVTSKSLRKKEEEED
ncbi:PRC-barrel domain-containing protein [Methanobacterium aggregans]|uniref:PRC-barrel domain-containing protein n=1 Tax=Methanobacterium aggregans TaxID=1615586 RepID=UPI001AE217B6|nr:sporulation protein YlmC with PRC-barrel domain [Methanobacterium aggregans]